MSNVLVLTLIANGAIADGSAVNTIQAKVTDATGVAVAAQIVSLSADAGVTIPVSLVTDATGVATANLTSSTAGTYNVTATLADGATVSAVVTFAAVPVTVVTDPTLAAATAAVVTVSALATFKAKAEADVAAFVAFVEHGIEVLGADAEAELVALKAKYL
ncbi:MAG: Ig-like domain-containing protein [Rouxiella badensis]|uniref:Ig-like domain-containing protein n=1 Tax=Rouxiella badensis TaxID=1646377 RepID=UPI003C4F3A15